MPASSGSSRSSTPRPVITDAQDAIDLPADAAGITFTDVRFGYVPSQPVLRGLSLRVKPGETVALVGASGSGKSTVAQLLPRFYDVRGGHDRDRRPRRQGPHPGLAAGQRSAWCMEDSFLFSTTVRANIAYGVPDATEEQVVAAAKAAQAHEFILELPHGYDTVVGEQGLTLSGGQRQRVALARALVTDPRLLILDDATSAIDPRLEAEIHAALTQIMRGRTTLIIAHRRSTLNLADRIAVLDEGRVVDTGTQAELELRCPLYRMLINGPEEQEEATENALATIMADRRRPQAIPGDLAQINAAAAGGNRGLAQLGKGPAERGAAGLGGQVTGIMDSLPPSPELLAQVDALPPLKDVPRVELAQAHAGDRQFTLRRLLRPLLVALVIGLALDGLDALAGLALPALVRNGIDGGVETKVYHVVVVASLIGLLVVVADWFVGMWRRRWWSAAPANACCSSCGSSSSPSCSGSAWTSTSASSPAGS